MNPFQLGWLYMLFVNSTVLEGYPYCSRSFRRDAVSFTEGINNTQPKAGELVFDETWLSVKWSWVVLGQSPLVLTHT